MRPIELAATVEPIHTNGRHDPRLAIRPDRVLHRRPHSLQHGDLMIGGQPPVTSSPHPSPRLPPKGPALVHIHPLAVVHPEAKLGQDVVVGPFAIVESDVTLGDGCRLESRVVVKSGTVMGPKNHLYEGAVLGGLPQHLRCPERVGRLVIGSENTFRENVTVHRALIEGHATIIGSDNMLMVNAHVAHDCHIANNTIITNSALLGGHSIIEDRAYLSGAVGTHQFCRIGQLAMVGGQAHIVQDVPPFVTVDGRSSAIVGLNVIGLRRAGFTDDDVMQLKEAYRVIFRSGLPLAEIMGTLGQRFHSGPATAFLEFFENCGQRGFIRERRMPRRATIKMRSDTDSRKQMHRVAG